MKFEKYLFVVFVLVVSTLQSCKQCSQKKESSDEQNDTLLSGINDKSAFQSIYYRFPTPNEVFSFIKSENLSFDINLVNPLKNVNKYLDSKSQTLGLGIYVADLAYITIFESYNNSIPYYKAIHNLSEKVRISSAYDLDVAKRIEKNLLNLDSLKNISVDSYSSMVEFLIMNNREVTLALIGTGAYIECFYIAFNLAGDYSNNNPLISKIIDLKYAFDNLYAYLIIYSDNKQVKEVAQNLENLKNLFNQIKEDKSSKTIVKQDKNGNLIFEGGTKLILEKDLYYKIRSEIYSIRKSMI